MRSLTSGNAPHYQQATPQAQQPVQQLPQRPQPGAYDPWAAPQAAPQPPPIDPHGYDLGAYMPAPVADPRTQRPTANPSWQAAVPAPLRAEPAYAPEPALAPLHDHGEYDEAADLENGEYEYEEEEDFEEPPRKARYGLIAASLVMAIVAGGGLAYAYKAYVGTAVQTASTPLVKSGTDPVKVKPADAGGTKFANTDSKMMDSLSGSGNSDGPRSVTTLTVGRDGTITPPVTLPAAAPAAVPGMILVGAPQPPPAPPPMAAAPAPKPTVLAAAPPPPPAAVAADVAADDVPAPVTAPPAKKPQKKVAAPSGVGGPTGANGFVAVLASVPASASSRMQAMQQFADLQQKYNGVLGSKAPDVVEAKLEKGTFHRLVVGPPASRDAANSVCSQLKAAGYTADCWVTAF